MKEKTLFKIALICALIGTFLLFVLSQMTELDASEIEKEYSYKGRITNVLDSDDKIIVEITKDKETLTSIKEMKK
ncbi:hypothetical protein KY326_00290 [Candidatus Woesearchaeota archaeon]|nr:hypothetical protein [Candidatus Woesearchaeota archaeon]